MPHEKHIFQIYFLKQDTRQKIGYIQASDMEKAEGYIKAAFINEDAPEGDINLECYDEGVSMFEISLCSQCERRNSGVCDTCEDQFECIEIKDIGTTAINPSMGINLMSGKRGV